MSTRGASAATRTERPDRNMSGQIKADVKHNGTVLVPKETTAVTFQDIAGMKASGVYYRVFDASTESLA